MKEINEEEEDDAEVESELRDHYENPVQIQDAGKNGKKLSFAQGKITSFQSTRKVGFDPKI